MPNRFSEILDALAPKNSKAHVELESWRPMWYSLRQPDREAFERRIHSVESLVAGMESSLNRADAMLLSNMLVQHKVIDRLS